MPLSIRTCGQWTRHHASAILLSSAGLAGIAGCAFNVSPGERLAATAHEEAESQTPVKTSALSRLLKRQPKEATAPETETATSSTAVRGRLFSALVDRFPSRKRDDVDPFLAAEIEAERKRAEIGADGKVADAKREEQHANSVVLAPKTQRSDAELWKIFSEESAATPQTAAANPTLEAKNPAAPPISRKALAHDGASNPFADSTPKPAPRTRTASTSVATAPVVEIQHEEANPFARFVNEPAGVDSTHEPEVHAANAARDQLQNLLTQARLQEQQGQLNQAHQTALAAAAVAEREQIKLADIAETPDRLVRRLEQRLKAATRDPFSDPFGAAEAQSSGTTPFSRAAAPAGRSIANTPAQSETAREGSAAAPAAPATAALSSVFPQAPEWRGVRANSPVSLAVVEQSEASGSGHGPATVRHADLSDAATAVRGTGRLLPRSLQSRETVNTLRDQPLAFTNEIATEGPLLAPPREVAPIAAAAPVVAEAAVAAINVPASGDEELDGSRNYGGWIVGGLLLVAGMWLLGVRGANPFGRHAAAKQ